MSTSTDETQWTIRDLDPDEGPRLGELLVDVYSRLPGFPGPGDQPAYYDMLRGIGAFAGRPAVRVLVAAADRRLAGGVVYFGDMAQYGAAGIAPTIRDASGIRLLGVDPDLRGHGIGQRLTRHCIDLARAAGHAEVILHTTRAMQAAWALYERLGFRRAEELDFMQQSLPVFGFRLGLR